MAASTPDPLLDVDNPSALIRARIRERRIFEARFLCRQLADELGEMERNSLEAELARLLGQVERLRQQASAHAEEGRHQQAARTFRDIERIAIDVPGLAAERQALEGARAVLARITDTAVQRELEQTRLEATRRRPPTRPRTRPWPATGGGRCGACPGCGWPRCCRPGSGRRPARLPAPRPQGCARPAGRPGRAGAADPHPAAGRRRSSRTHPTTCGRGPPAPGRRPRARWLPPPGRTPGQACGPRLAPALSGRPAAAVRPFP